MKYGPFEADFEQLDIEHVHSFLAEADEEGLNWEAKGDGAEHGKNGRLRSEHVQRSVCALANQIGGVVVLGAVRRAGKWSLPGVEIRGDEPGLWLEKAAGWLRPIPRCRVKTWPVDETRTAAVIEVEPLIQTPCMTRDGQVFERVSSESVRVTDPTRLAELIRRGEAARENAELLATRAAANLGEVEDPWLRWSVSVVVGLAATNYEPDIASRLFHERFIRLLASRAEELLLSRVERSTISGARNRIAQSFVWHSLLANDLQWVIRVRWDGTVAVNALFTGAVMRHQSLFDGLVGPAWTLCSELVEAIGGYGDTHVVFQTEPIRPEDAGGERHSPEIGFYKTGEAPPAGTVYSGLPQHTTIRRWGTVAAPTSEELGSMQREFQRAAGLWSFEGSPDPPG